LDQTAQKDQPGPDELAMKRGYRPSAEQGMLMLRQFELQTARKKSIAIPCKEADIYE
jgi:putative transposase